jgi:hypothetical protein
LAFLTDSELVHRAESRSRDLSQEAVLLVVDKLKLRAANRNLLAEFRHHTVFRDLYERIISSGGHMLTMGKLGPIGKRGV